jgi:hypothetical protein
MRWARPAGELLTTRLLAPGRRAETVLGILYFFHGAAELSVFIAAVAVEGEPELQDYVPHPLPPSVPPAGTAAAGPATLRLFRRSAAHVLIAVQRDDVGGSAGSAASLPSTEQLLKSVERRW